ncbi:MAG: TonB-dependent receptor, partial [Pedobacter sp.]
VLLNEDKFTSENGRFIGNIYAQVNILKGLNFKTQYGFDELKTENISFQNRINGDGFASNGVATNTFYRSSRWNFVNTLNYNTTIAEKHNLSALIGEEEQKTTADNWGASRSNVSDPFVTTYQGSFGVIVPSGNGQGENAFRSFFGNIGYDYMKRYFIAGSFRRDGYSGLAAGNKYGNFGGASVGWQISEESFFKESSITNVLSRVKIRGSYGVVGNINIGNFPALSLYSIGLYGTSPTVTFSQAGNPDLRWERSKKTDIGLNFSLFNGRIEADIDYYYNNIDQLVQAAQQAPSKGIPGNSITANIGSMYNKGFEFALTTNNITKGDFTWTSSINFSTVKNKVTSLFNNADVFGVTSLETVNVTRVGYSLGSIYVVPTDGVDPATGERIFINRNGERIRFSFSRPSATRYQYLDGAKAGQTAPAIDAS